MKGSIRENTEFNFSFEEGEAEFILNQILNKSEDLIYLILPENLRFVFVNERFSQVLGYSIDELQSDKFEFMQLIAPRSREEIESRTNRRLKGEKVEPQIRFWAKTKEGDEIPLHASLIDVVWRGRKAILGIARDISLETEQITHLRETIYINQAILDNIPTGILLLDPNLKFRYINPKGEEVLGFKNEEVLGVSFMDVEVHQEIKKIASEIQANGIKKIKVSPVILSKETPKPIYSQWLFAPVFQHGEVMLVQAIIVDLTETVEKQKELEFKNKELEKVNLELETLNKRLDEFVTIASHDLKAPVRRIVTFGTLLQNSLKGIGENEKEQLGLIVETSKHLISMIESFVAFSRLDETDLHIQPFEMEKIIDFVLKMSLRDMVLEKEAIIEIERPLPSIVGDYKLFTQVWQNLIQNAIKFSRQEVSPRIKIWAEKKKDHIIFFCRDNGMGIIEEERETIFEMFKRGSDVKVQGAGIGLSIVRKIVEMHGGSIAVMNNETEPGSTFYFTVPNHQS